MVVIQEYEFKGYSIEPTQGVGMVGIVGIVGFLGMVWMQRPKENRHWSRGPIKIKLALLFVLSKLEWTEGQRYAMISNLLPLYTIYVFLLLNQFRILQNNKCMEQIYFSVWIAFFLNIKNSEISEKGEKQKVKNI